MFFFVNHIRCLPVIIAPKSRRCCSFIDFDRYIWYSLTVPAAANYSTAAPYAIPGASDERSYYEG